MWRPAGIGQNSPVHLLVVRHGKAGSRHDWDGPDEERLLSPAGWHQAGALVPLLARYPVERVLASPAVRCIQTVEPLARARDLVVESRPEIGEGHALLATRLVRALAEAEQPTVLCTHGDVIPAILEWLAEEVGVELPSEVRWAKGSTWALKVKAGQVTSATYLPPPGHT